MKTNQKIITFLAIISIILLILIFYWINYLTTNDYVEGTFGRENFTTDISLNNATSNTVDLPLTTTYSCKNFCSPTARCAITGQQCMADIDCPGCKPNTPPSQRLTKSVPGDNDAGKLTLGVTPQYSTLTTDIGTQAKIITDNKFSKPAQANFGVDTWTSSFVESEKLFNARYKPPQLLNMPNYPKRFSMLGSFYDDGPLPSNAYFS